MGLTGGIVDVGGLYDCLRGIYDNRAASSILDKYSEIRRQKYMDIVDTVSSTNLRRLFELDPDHAIADDNFFQLAKKAETDPDFSRQLQNVSCRSNLSPSLSLAASSRLIHVLLVHRV